MVLVADEICISSLIWDVKKNTRRLRKNTRGEKKIRGAKKKYASTKTKIRMQIILVQMEQHILTDLCGAQKYYQVPQKLLFVRGNYWVPCADFLASYHFRNAVVLWLGN